MVDLVKQIVCIGVDTYMLLVDAQTLIVINLRLETNPKVALAHNSNNIILCRFLFVVSETRTSDKRSNNVLSICSNGLKVFQPLQTSTL